MGFALLIVSVSYIVSLACLANCDKLTGGAGVRFGKYRKKVYFETRLLRVVTLSQLPILPISSFTLSSFPFLAFTLCKGSTGPRFMLTLCKGNGPGPIDIVNNDPATMRRPG